jgi:L-2-hydroxyglutarate oxidase LhgO
LSVQGVVGLAVARPLAVAGQDALVVDKAHDISRETSALKSQSIYAGTYYRTGSLKAMLCLCGECQWVLDGVTPVAHPFPADNQLWAIGQGNGHSI